MNIKFITNDYLLVWNILFIKSITEKYKNYKKKLWNTYREEYNNIYYEKELILKDYKNFIPDNDIVYNAIIEKEDFNSIKKDAEKNRINTMKVWDKNNKVINHFFKKIIRTKLPEYQCFILSKDFNILEITKLSNKESAYIVGKQYKNDNEFLVQFLYKIIKEEIKINEKESPEIKDIILEMAIDEFATIIDKKSHYKDCNKNNLNLKEQIYPYWLMFIGIKKEDMVEYKKRDGFEFDENKMAYEKELINMSIGEFIDFVIRNKRYIVKNNKVNNYDNIEHL